MISVIVPIYCVERYLRQCVDSICNQTYDDLEILLIDDGSPDQCGEICEAYARKDRRVRVFHTENQGVSASRNFGIKKATGEYIGFVDPDDWIEPDMFETLLRRLKETKADISGCGFDVVRENSAVQTKRANEVYTGINTLKAMLDDKIDNYLWNKLYRRDVFQKAMTDGIIFPKGKCYEDISVMHRLIASADTVAMTAAPKYHYRMRPDSIVKSFMAKSLFQYADAYFLQYHYFRDERPELYSEEPQKVTLIAAKGISKVWRWWHGCSAEEKRMYKNRIEELKRFSRKNIPLFGYRSWPLYLRISAVCMHSSSKISFAILYSMNQSFRKARPEKGNTLRSGKKTAN